MKWIDVKNKLPPQGLKVLCFSKGDVYVACRFQECWFPMPFLDSKYATYDSPEQWQYMELPREYTGRISVLIDNELLDMDACEKKDIIIFLKLKNGMKNAMDARKEIILRPKPDSTTQEQ